MTTFVRLEPKNKVDISQIVRTSSLVQSSNYLNQQASSVAALSNTLNAPARDMVLRGFENFRSGLENEARNFLLGAGLSNSGVTFLITPNVSESSSATYGEISDIRMPASIIYYLGSPSRMFSITAKLFARTQSEADYTYTIIRLLRSWRMPEKGAGQEGSGSGIELATGSAGQSTPKILQLSGYNGMFNNITVVLTELNFTFPEDVDYISASSGHKVPILSEVTISLKEGRSINDLKQFDINSFRSGRLPNW
jgi:hypothetical protein